MFFVVIQNSSNIAPHLGCGAYWRAALVNFFVLDAALIFEGGAYSNKCGMCETFKMQKNSRLCLNYK